MEGSYPSQIGHDGYICKLDSLILLIVQARYLVRDSLDLFVGGFVGIPYIDVLNPLLLSHTFCFSFVFFLKYLPLLTQPCPKTYLPNSVFDPLLYIRLLCIKDPNLITFEVRLHFNFLI